MYCIVSTFGLSIWPPCQPQPRGPSISSPS
jgi:hypothetical protein